MRRISRRANGTCVAVLLVIIIVLIVIIIIIILKLPIHVLCTLCR